MSINKEITQKPDIPSETLLATEEFQSNSVPLSLLTIKLVTTKDAFVSLKEEWNGLNDRSPKGTVFISWEWLYTWWEIYQNEGHRTLYILTCRDHKGKLVGIAPFQIVNNPLKYFPCSRQLVFLGTDESDGSRIFGEYFDLLIETQLATSVIHAFSDYLIKNRRLWDGAKFHHLLDGSYLSRLFKEPTGKIIKSETERGLRTIIELPASYTEYLMSLRKKMRNNITRTYSRLNAEQDFTIQSVSENFTEEQLDWSLGILSGLNKMRRDSQARPSVFEFKNFEKFHRQLAKRLLPLGKIQLRILRFGNEPVAALFSFLDKDTIHVYQSGFVPEYGQRYSLLTTMLSQEISSSIENQKLRRFNLMYSDDDKTYKHRYSASSDTMFELSYDKPGLRLQLFKLLHGPVKSLLKKMKKWTVR